MNYGRYQIIKEVGRGSMGVVFQARDPHIGRLVALKVLRKDRMESENFVQRFLKEAKVIGRLTHPNILAIYDVGEEQGAVYIAMEFLEGVSLSELARGSLPGTKEVVALGVQLAETLDYAHKKGVVHRDVKPSNIIVQSDGQIKITDFGIAHVDDATATLQTQAGEIMGTPAYMSPEQVLGQPVDGRSDIFSLGIVLYELTTGLRPFGGEGKGLVTVLNEIVQFTPQEPAALAASVPRELSRLIMKALDKEPAKRFQTGKEFAEALKACHDAPVPSPPQPAPGLAQKRRVNFGMALGVVTAAVAVADGLYLVSSRHDGRPAPAPVAVTKVSPQAGNSSGLRLVESAPAATAAKIPDAAHPAPPAPAVPEHKNPAAPAAGNATAAPGSSLRGSPKERGRTGRNASRGRAKPAHKTAPAELPAVALPKTSPEAARDAAREAPAAAAKPVQRFAFLKVGSTPAGARVYINGAQKGTTPVIVKLDLGQYRVRLSQPGFHEVERQITLEKMMEYPLLEDLKPIE